MHFGKGRLELLRGPERFLQLGGAELLRCQCLGEAMPVAEKLLQLPYSGGLNLSRRQSPRFRLALLGPDTWAGTLTQAFYLFLGILVVGFVGGVQQIPANRLLVKNRAALGCSLRYYRNQAGES